MYLSGSEINIIVFRQRDKDWGLCVEEVFAYMDIVIKPMESKMNPAQIFSGIAVLGSGELSLVMNLKELLRVATTTSELISASA